MRRTTLFFAAALASSGALAEEAANPTSRRPLAQGTFSHGDSSVFVEDMFGGAVEGAQADQPGGTRKYDPAIRWEGPNSKAR